MPPPPKYVSPRRWPLRCGVWLGLQKLRSCDTFTRSVGTKKTGFGATGIVCVYVNPLRAYHFQCRRTPPNAAAGHQNGGFLQVLADILYRLQVYRVFRVYRLIRVWGGAIPAPGSFGTIFSCYYFTTVYCTTVLF